MKKIPLKALSSRNNSIVMMKLKTYIKNYFSRLDMNRPDNVMLAGFFGGPIISGAFKYIKDASKRLLKDNSRPPFRTLAQAPKDRDNLEKPKKINNTIKVGADKNSHNHQPVFRINDTGEIADPFTDAYLTRKPLSEQRSKKLGYEHSIYRKIGKTKKGDDQYLQLCAKPENTTPEENNTNSKEDAAILEENNTNQKEDANISKENANASEKKTLPVKEKVVKEQSKEQAKIDKEKTDRFFAPESEEEKIANDAFDQLNFWMQAQRKIGNNNIKNKNDSND